MRSLRAVRISDALEAYLTTTKQIAGHEEAGNAERWYIEKLEFEAAKAKQHYYDVLREELGERPEEPVTE